MNKTFSVVSLGCAKNLVNTEQMLFLMNEAGFELIPDIEKSDIVIINTCGFIDSAKQEAIDTIFETYNINNNIIVTGCLPERYKDEIIKEIPEIKSFLGVCSYDKIVEASNAILLGQTYYDFSDNSSPIDEVKRIVSTGPSWAYIKIAEGCNNFCAFCAIPYIRGRYRSREMNNILSEAKELASQGIKEIILIAQDITKYGVDLYNKPSLARLCHELSEISGIKWIRLHYLYPELIDDELINEISSNDKIVKYLDIPIQHINNNILKKMNRHGTGDDIKILFNKLRSSIPNLVLRTSIITGLPGETEKEFIQLCEFLKEARIERVGVFPFSPEDGTPASKMEHCSYETAVDRANFILDEIQGPIMDNFCETFIGKSIDVLVTNNNGNKLFGRTYADSPDIDGEVEFEGSTMPGDFAKVLITDVDDGILIGEEIRNE